jgi:hypothetical protein
LPAFENKIRWLGGVDEHAVARGEQVLMFARLHATNAFQLNQEEEVLPMVLPDVSLSTAHNVHVGRDPRDVEPRGVEEGYASLHGHTPVMTSGIETTARRLKLGTPLARCGSNVSLCAD